MKPSTCEYLANRIKMTDTLTWIIALAFYAPFHYLGPFLVIILTGSEPQALRKRLIISILIDCSLSMLVAFTVAFWLVEVDLQLTMLVMLTSMCIPYLHIGFNRRYRFR